MSNAVGRIAATLGLLCFCLAGAGCSLGCTREDESAALRQKTVDAVAALQQDLELPKHFMTEEAPRTSEEFDPNRYFSVLDHLSMEPGYVLDYVYLYQGMGGLPILYARQADQPAYRTYSDYVKAVGSEPSRSGYLEHVQVDGTAEGFFQFVALYIQGGQFYLFWHAGYNDVAILCDRGALEALFTSFDAWDLKLPDDVKKAARELELDPLVEFQDDTVLVQVVTFSKWVGFNREAYTISRSFPHKVLDQKVEIVIPYDCGIRF